MKNLKNKKGITLVEIIVVLVIMAILAAVLIGAYTGYINRAKDQNDRMEARSVLLAITALYNEDYARKNLDPTALTAVDTVANKAANKDKLEGCTFNSLEDIHELTGLDTTKVTISDITITDGVVSAFTYTALSGTTWTYSATDNSFTKGATT